MDRTANPPMTHESLLEIEQENKTDWEPKDYINWGNSIYAFLQGRLGKFNTEVNNDMSNLLYHLNKLSTLCDDYEILSKKDLKELKEDLEDLNKAKKKIEQLNEGMDKLERDSS
ncbi:hypothetical protein EMPG_17041 [Blastomyces silverae]|uniref:Uncharacterized protein n=1 Tax=Blastomyces silverae TaxID=2060906 RepID=A0A0H1BE50_9EURO|nr:hypothetical protein EMPG_17041 [Blastomyces silverae]